MGSQACLIWGPEFEARDAAKWTDISRYILGLYSDRTGGEYRITGEAKDLINTLDDTAKAKLTSWLVWRRLQGEEAPLVTTDAIENARNRQATQVHERGERLLRFLAGMSETVGDSVTVGVKTNAAYAWSESTEWEEVAFFLRYLVERGWLDYDGRLGDINLIGVRHGVVTVDGFSRIAEQEVNVNSAQAFVAMWFNESTDRASERGIEPAVEAAGFKPYRVDREHSLEKIDDRIIAEIRRSRFLVADMTHGQDGARGSVYFEAGFALGLPIPVIFTCRNDMFNQLHFDTRQYPHIGWSEGEMDQFRGELEYRIRALIGAGPNSQD